jgi:hypothetical protein
MAQRLCHRLGYTYPFWLTHRRTTRRQYHLRVRVGWEHSLQRAEEPPQFAWGTDTCLLQVKNQFAISAVRQRLQDTLAVSQPIIVKHTAPLQYGYPTDNLGIESCALRHRYRPFIF